MEGEEGREDRLKSLGDLWVKFCIHQGATENIVRLSAMVQDNGSFLKESGILPRASPEAFERGKSSHYFAVLTEWTRLGPKELSPGGKLTSHSAPPPASPPSPPAPEDGVTEEVDYSAK